MGRPSIAIFPSAEKGYFAMHDSFRLGELKYRSLKATAGNTNLKNAEFQVPRIYIPFVAKE